MMHRPAAALVVTCLALGLGHAQALTAQLNRTPSVTLAEAATRLDSAATIARTQKHGAEVPMLRVVADSSTADVKTLNAWLGQILDSIRREKSGARQAHDMRALARALRRLNPPTTNPSPRNDPSAVAGQVLAQRAYAQAGGGPAPAPAESWWDKFIGFLGKLFQKILSGVFRATASKPIVGQIVAILLVALLAGVVAYAMLRLVRVLLGMRRRRVVNEGTPLPQPSDPDQVYHRGLLAAREGRYAQAVALLFQASLLWFDRQGTLPLDASLTPTEYRWAVKRAKAEASPYFDVIARAFVLAAFAETPVSPSDWSKAQAAYSNLVAAPAT